ncbi:MAG: nickel pincer cofactor biosynthesis protein LarC, partial [Thermoproteota archaeon]
MVVVIDPQIAGISGDMLLCSLVDLGANKVKIIDGIKLSNKFLPNSIIKQIDFKKIEKHGIEATALFLEIDEHVHERKGIEIKKAIMDSTNEIGLSNRAKVFAESCIDTLIFSESQIHGLPIDSVHFHEASSIDTLIDIVGTAIAIDDLGMFDEEILCMPIAVGGGNVTFSHGTMSNPASAILEILKNSKLSIHGSQVKDELTTPTGASILVNLSKISMDYYPSMYVTSIGYGAGKKNFDEFSNVLKIVRGTQKNNFQLDSVKILETNVDDVSGEIMGNLIEKIMNKGAKDVSIYHGIAKKGRPTNLISVICDDTSMHEIMDILVIETGTLGIRVTTSNRFI